MASNPSNRSRQDLDAVDRAQFLARQLPLILAGSTNLVLLVVSAIKGDGTLLITSIIGVLLVSVIGLGVETTARSSRRLERRMDNLGDEVAAIGASSLNAVHSLSEGYATLQAAFDSFAKEVTRGRHGQASLLSRDEFYERARQLVRMPRNAGGVARVFNMYGSPPATSTSRRRWFEYLSSEEFARSEISLRRIKGLGDEESFDWTLQLIDSSRSNPRISVALLVDQDQRSLDALLYPLNAHTYFGIEAFILSPGFSEHSSGSDAAVIWIVDSDVVGVLERYHDLVYRRSVEVLAAGRVNVGACTRVASQLGFDSESTRSMLDALTRP